jgi:glutamine cyclotransferase
MPTRRASSIPARRRVLPWTIAAAAVALAVYAAIGAGGKSSDGAAAEADPIAYAFQVVHRYPHDPDAFTQGLLYRDGFLYESTGLNGHSSLRKIRPETGAVVRRMAIDDRYFAEGLTDWNDELIQLTWQSHVGFVYGLDDFATRRTFTYAGEGWGLTHDATRLILSDGSATLRLLDPATFQEIGRLPVTDQGAPVTNLNELEFVNGTIYANVWQTDVIVLIAPATGHVVGRLNLRALRPADTGAVHPPDVLNGIAYDAAGRRLFVTGKWWPTLYEIRIGPAAGAATHGSPSP